MHRRHQLPRLSVLLAGCFMLCVSAAYGDESPSISKLQKLFTTPYERAQLDARRRRGDQPQDISGQDTKQPLPPIEVELKGVMMRKGAPDVVWVNRQNTLKSGKIDERISVRADRISSDNRVPMRVDSKYIKLKPGQVWNEAEQTIMDKYQTKRLKKQATGMDTDTVPADNE